MDDLYLPKILYGKARDVKPAWWNATCLAWETGSWDALETTVDFVPASQLSSHLYVWRPNNSRMAGQGIWRLYMINDGLVKLRDTIGTESNGDRFRDFLCDGLTRFWFVLGLLDTTAPHGLLAGRLLSGAAPARSKCMLYLGRIVQWLDALEAITPFCQPDEPDPQGLRIGHTVIPESMLLVLLVLKLAKGAGFDVGLWKVVAAYGGNLTSALIGEGIVQRGHSGEYELANS